MPKSPKASFKFINYSGTYMLRLQTAHDLQALQLLDEPFWIATSAPIHHLRCDQKFLDFLDADHDGRILSRDIRRAHAWLIERLENLDHVVAASETLHLAHLKQDHPPAQALATAAKRILSNLDTSDTETISLSQVRDHQSYRAKGFHNGDGVIPAGAIEDDEPLKQFVTDIVATMGASTDLNGNPGVAEADLDAFLKNANDLLAWRHRSEAAGDDGTSLFPLGDETAAGYETLTAIREPIERFFRLCRLRRMNDMLERQTPVPPSPVDIQAEPEAIEDALRQAPLAQPNPEEELHLEGAINPFYRDIFLRFVNEVARRICGEEWPGASLSVAEWRQINQAFAAYEGWLQAKSGGEVEKLGPDTLRDYVDGPLADRLRELIKHDQLIGQDLSVVQDLEHLILMQRWFLELVNNFVSFHNLYDPEERALFEMGRMVIGGRVFNLNMQVKDINAHSKLAPNSGILLLYSEVTSDKPEETFYVVTPVTSRTLGRLAPERRGVLFDLQGRQWDTRVVKVVENPVSLWSAIIAPFVRLAQLIGKSFEKIVGSSEKQLESSVTQSFTKVETGMKTGIAQAGQPPPQAPAAPAAADPAQPVATDSGGGARAWMLSGSVAFAALGSSFAFIAKTLGAMGLTNILIALLVGLGIILIPTILIAWYKLRKRNLGSLLEASGWAINAQMRVTRRLARVLAPSLTHPGNFAKVHMDRTRYFLRKLKKAHPPGTTPPASDQPSK